MVHQPLKIRRDFDIAYLFRSLSQSWSGLARCLLQLFLEFADLTVLFFDVLWFLVSVPGQTFSGWCRGESRYGT